MKKYIKKETKKSKVQRYGIPNLDSNKFKKKKHLTLASQVFWCKKLHVRI